MATVLVRSTARLQCNCYSLAELHLRCHFNGCYSMLASCYLGRPGLPLAGVMPMYCARQYEVTAYTPDHKLAAAAVQAGKLQRLTCLHFHLQESELQQLTELHAQLQRYHTQSSCQQAALASIASAAAGALRQLQPSSSLTSSADCGTARQTLDPKPHVDLSLALAVTATGGAGPAERPEDAQALVQQLLAALSEAQHTAAERQRALTEQVGEVTGTAGAPCTADLSAACVAGFAQPHLHLSSLLLDQDVCQAASLWLDAAAQATPVSARPRSALQVSRLQGSCAQQKHQLLAGRQAQSETAAEVALQRQHIRQLSADLQERNGAVRRLQQEVRSIARVKLVSVMLLLSGRGSAGLHRQTQHVLLWLRREGR